MRPYLLVPLTLALALTALPTAAAQQETSHIWIDVAAPTRLTGSIQAIAPQGHAALLGHSPDATLTTTGGVVHTTTITQSLLQTPQGPTLIDQRIERTTQTLPPGALRPSGSVDLRLQASHILLSSQMPDSAPDRIWSESRAWLSSHPDDRPAGPAQAPAQDRLTTRANHPLVRATGGSLHAHTDSAWLYQGTLAASPWAIGAGTTETRRVDQDPIVCIREPCQLPTIITRTTTYHRLETTDAILDAPPGQAVVELTAGSFRLDLDGALHTAWATGQLATPDGPIEPAGRQLILSGALTWAVTRAPESEAPKITMAGQGVLAYVHVGALPTPLPPAETIAMAGGALALGAAAAAAAWYWPLLKFGVAAALYARVPKEKILQHKGREQVYDLIMHEPGISTNRLAEHVEFGWSTLTYHLRVLERNEAIVSVRDGRHKRFFDRKSGRYANGRKVLVSILKNDATRDIAGYILGHPGVTQKEVGTAFSLAPSSVHWHVARLIDADLIRKARERHRVRYFPGQSWHNIDAADVGLDRSLVDGAQAAAAA